MRIEGICLLLAAGVGLPPAAVAQTYPVKPVRIVVPFSPGASTDILARVIGQRLSETMNQQFIVENRAAGAAGTVGASTVAKAPPDGYTLMMANSSVLNVAPHVYKKIPFELRDFAPVALVAWVPLMLTVHPSLPVKNVKDLIALARARPGQLSFSSSGTGSSLHLAGELFKSLGKVDILHIPYKGSSNAMIDVVGGQVQMTFGAIATALPFVNNGKVRALAVTTQNRFPLLPEVPTMAEAAFPTYDMLNWLGLVAPAQTPPDIINRINAEVAKWAAQSDTRQKVLALGVDIGGGTPAHFGDTLVRGYNLIGNIVKTAGLQPE